MDSPGGTINLQMKWLTDVPLDAGFSGVHIKLHSACVEKIWVEITQHEVGIGNRCTLSTQPITDGSRVSASALGAYMNHTEFSACD